MAELRKETIEDACGELELVAEAVAEKLDANSCKTVLGQ